MTPLLVTVGSLRVRNSVNGVISIRMIDKSQPVKIFHMERIVNFLSNFTAREMYLDANRDADASVTYLL